MPTIEFESRSLTSSNVTKPLNTNLNNDSMSFHSADTNGILDISNQELQNSDTVVIHSAD